MVADRSSRRADFRGQVGCFLRQVKRHECGRVLRAKRDCGQVGQVAARMMPLLLWARVDLGVEEEPHQTNGALEVVPQRSPQPNYGVPLSPMVRGQVRGGGCQWTATAALRRSGGPEPAGPTVSFTGQADSEEAFSARRARPAARKD